jgi:hypothetical protein
LNVNKLIYAAAGGIAVAAVAVFFLLGPGVKPPGTGDQKPQVTVSPPAITLKNVTAVKTSDDSASMLVTFSVKNTNPTTLVLEAIHYDVSVDNVRLATGDWGGTGEGFVTGSDQLTVLVSGTTVNLKDSHATVLKRSTENAKAWDDMVSGHASFAFSGTTAYRLTAANLETTAQEQTFNLTYP